MIEYSVIAIKDEEETYDVATIRYTAFGECPIEKIVKEAYECFKAFWNNGNVYDNYLGYMLENGRNELVKKHFKKLRRRVNNYSLDTVIKVANTIYPGYHIKLLDSKRIIELQY